MSLDPSRVVTLTPSQFFVFTVPNPVSHDCYLRGPLLRFAVFDSPRPPSDDDVPILAAMIVPAHRESDWIFCTECGQAQLLLSYANVSRLVLIGNIPPANSASSIYVRPPATLDVDKEKQKLEKELKPLLIALHPKVCFQNGLPEPDFLTYEDNAVFRVTISAFRGPFVGEFLVEDVEVESKPGGKKDLRRRLRFKRMPNLVQSEFPLIPTITDDGVVNMDLDLPSLKKMNEVGFKVDTRVLVPAYLTAMVSGIFLIVSPLNQRIEYGCIPRVLCLGVGGGALLSFLNTRLGFQVVGVDYDEVVLKVARQLFGLRDGNSLSLFCEDAVQMIETLACRLTQQNPQDLQANAGCLDDKFDVVMVDLDATDAIYGFGAPPVNFLRRPVFEAARSVLNDHGVFIMNVVPLNYDLYLALVQELKNVFHKVYEINVGNEENNVLVATLSPLASRDHYNALSIMLRQAISGAYIDSINEV